MEDSSITKKKCCCSSTNVCSAELAFFVSCKLWSYVGLRFLYPLNQFLAEDWGLKLPEMSAVLAAGEFVPAGLFASCGDAVGPYNLALASFTGLGLASSLMLLPPAFISLLFIRFLYGFSMFLFMVAAQTAATSKVPEERKDCVTGVLEIPYSASALVLVPLLSMAYDSSGWRTPFLIMAIATVVHIPVLIWLTIRDAKDRAVSAKAIKAEEQGAELQRLEANTEGAESSKTTRNANKSNRQGLKAGFYWSTGALAYNLSGVFLTMTANVVATEFGFLLHSIYGLDEGDAGTAALVMGTAELSGVLLATVNFGPGLKALEIAGGCLVAGVAVLALVGAKGLGVALASLFVVFLLCEFGTVQRISRATLFAGREDASAILGCHIQFQVIGRTIGAAIAATLFYAFPDNLERGHMLCSAVAGGSAVAMCVFARLSSVLLQRHSTETEDEVEGIGETSLPQSGMGFDDERD